MLARIKSLFVSTHCICVCVCVCVVTGLKCRFCLHINIHCKTEVFTGSDLWRSWKTSASHWNRAAATTSSAYPGLGQTSLESHQGWSGSLSGQPTLMLPRPLTVLLEPLHLQFLAFLPCYITRYCQNDFESTTSAILPQTVVGCYWISTGIN